MPSETIDKVTTRSVGDQTIRLGNCLAIMAEMSPESIDIVITSPPYNLNLAYGAYDDSRNEQDYINWMLLVADQIKRLLRPDGSFFLNIAGSNSRPYIPFEILIKLRAAGFHLQNHITWIKSIGIGAESSGHFKPVPGRRFMHHNHEHIFHLTLANNVALDRLAIGIPFQDKSNIARRGHARDLRCRGNTWFIPYPTVKSKAQKFWHPATFPVELPLWCIYLHGKCKPLVLDPFLGTGTTLVAAHFARAAGVGIDIDSMYIDTAWRRVSEALEKTMIVQLTPDETAFLYRQDESERGGGGWQSRFVIFQQKLNKTTGELPLSDDDVAWIKKHGSQPKKGSWQKWLNAAFGRHLDLAAA